MVSAIKIQLESQYVWTNSLLINWLLKLCNVCIESKITKSENFITSTRSTERYLQMQIKRMHEIETNRKKKHTENIHTEKKNSSNNVFG